MNNTTAPSTPSSGKVALYTSSTTKRLNAIDDTGTIVQVGSMNTVYDVTDWGLVGNGSTDNLSAFNTLFASLPVNSTVYFPAGTYNFSAEATLNRDIHVCIKGCGRARSMIQSTSATANVFNVTVAAYYYDFIDLGFTSTQTRTAGAYISATANDAYLNVKNCEMMKQFNGISLTGAIAANLGVIDDCQFDNPAANGASIVVNGSNINMVISNCTINNTGVAGTSGLNILACGAVQVHGCDFIGGVNALLCNPTSGVVSALKITNTFFDQCTLGSTVKFSGTGSISRVTFTECGITCGVSGAPGVTACEIAGTGTGTGVPESIEFIGCDFYNNGGSGTTTGILVTGCKGFGVHNCVIAGFTNGIDITPYNTNGYTHFIIDGNRIGTAENFAGNGTGIQLRAGSVQYGPSLIVNNDFSGNTTQGITTAATLANTSVITIKNNIGLTQEPHGGAPGTTIALGTATKMGVSIPFLANTWTAGTSARITAFVTVPATAQTLTLTLQFGANDTNADATIVTLVCGAGTAAVGGAKIVAEFQILSSTTAVGSITIFNNGSTGVTNAVVQAAASTATTAVVLSANRFLGLYGNSATASAVVVRSVYYEVISQ